MVSSRTPRCKGAMVLGTRPCCQRAPTFRPAQLALHPHQPVSVFHQGSRAGTHPRVAFEERILPVPTAVAAVASTGFHLQPGGGGSAKLAATLQKGVRANLPFHPAFRPRISRILSSSSSSSESSDNSYKSPAAAHDGGRGRGGRAGRGGSRSQAGGRQGRDEGWVASGSGRGTGGQGGWGAGRGGGRGGGGRGRGRGGGGGGRGRGRMGGGDAGDSLFSTIKDMGFAELQQLVQQYGGSMKQNNFLAVVSRLKSVPASSLEQKVAFLKQFLQMLEPQLQQLQPRGLAEIISTCSKLGYGDAGLYSSCLGVFVSKLQQADARILANAVYATATAPNSGRTRQQCWPVVEQQLLPAFVKAVADAAPQAISNVVWGIAKLGEKLSRLQLQELVKCLLTQLNAAKPQEIANFIWGVATMGQQLPDHQVQLLVAGLIQKLDAAKPQDIANTIWGVATMGQQLPDHQVQPLMARFANKLGAAKPQELANTIWGVATMGQQLPDQQVQLLVAGLANKVDAANPQEIANTIWAVATMGQQLPDHQVQLLVAGFANKLGAATPQEIADTVWGVATMGQQLPDHQVELLVVQLVNKLDAAKPQAIANTIVGVARMGQQLPDQQVQLLVAGLVNKLDSAKPQEIANTIWGVATMGQQVHADQLQELLKQLLPMLATAKPLDVSHAVWGIATMGQQLPAEQLQQLLKVLALKLPSAHPQAVANAMWGVARLQPQPFLPVPLLAPEAKEAIIGMLPAVIPQHLANIAWACGMLGYRDEQLLLPFFNKAKEVFFVDEGSSSMAVVATTQHLSNMCWAAAVLNMQQLISHVDQFAAAVSSKWEEAVPEGKRQLYQVHMWLLDQQGNSRGFGDCLTKQQLQDCREQWQKQMAEDTSSAKASSAHRAVYAAAHQLSFLSQPPELEARTADGLHSIDVLVITSGGVKVAIEFDGPTHFRQPDLQPTGPTQWRNRSLAARGYVVVSVPYWEWNPLLPKQSVDYLEGKVQQALAGAS